MKPKLYPELKLHLKKRGIHKTPEQWGDELYDRLFVVRRFLEARAGDWDSLCPDARLVLLRKVLPAPTRETLVPGAVVVTELPSA